MVSGCARSRRCDYGPTTSKVRYDCDCPVPCSHAERVAHVRSHSNAKLTRTAHGRNLTLLRYPTFARLIQVGLPNRLRGEIWEVCSGSIHSRAHHAGEYARVLEVNEGKTSLSTEEIEKDLNRSLPEYQAFQTPEGIEALRRVLTAFSWLQPDVGYCQGLNLIVSAFLMCVAAPRGRSDAPATPQKSNASGCSMSFATVSCPAITVRSVAVRSAPADREVHVRHATRPCASARLTQC